MTRHVLSVLAVLAFAATAHANSFSHVSNLATDLQYQADALAAEVELHLARSPFERRLLNDAAELYRVAGVVAGRADRYGSIPVMQAETRHLAVILDRVDRTLSEAEVAAIRDPRDRGLVRFKTQHVRQILVQMCSNVSRLNRSLDVLASARTPHHHVRYVSPPHYHGVVHAYQPVVVTPRPGFSFSNGRVAISIGR